MADYNRSIGLLNYVHTHFNGIFLKSGLEGAAPINSEKQKNPAKILTRGTCNSLKVIANDQNINHVEIYKGARQIRKACKKLS